MRFVLALLTLWLTVVVFAISDQYDISREPLGKYLIVLGLGFLSTIVHESGHAIAGWKLGYQIKRIGVLPFEYDFQRKKFSQASVPRSADLAGYVIASYPGKVPPLRRALFALAGPLTEAMFAGLLFAGVAAAQSQSLPSAIPMPAKPVEIEGGDAFPGPPGLLPSSAKMKEVMDEVDRQHRADALLGLLTMLAALAAGSSVINLLPIGRSDGQIIWQSLRDHLNRR